MATDDGILDGLLCPLPYVDNSERERGERKRMENMIYTRDQLEYLAEEAFFTLYGGRGPYHRDGRDYWQVQHASCQEAWRRVVRNVISNLDKYEQVAAQQGLARVPVKAERWVENPAYETATYEMPTAEEFSKRDYR